MKLLISSLTLATLIGSTAFANSKLMSTEKESEISSGVDGVNIVYGKDDRAEVNLNQYRDLFSDKILKFRLLARSTGALIKKSNLKLNDKGTHYIFTKNVVTHEDAYQLCPGEKFMKQPTAASCSGFLVSKDIYVTAGHCAVGMMDNVCNDYYIVFDYKAPRKGDSMKMKIPKSNVYNCKKKLKAVLERASLADYAILKLDRKVTNRRPLKFRKEFKSGDYLNKKTKLVVVGNPSGLPTKIANGASVKVNKNEVYFEANLDTFGGNSGSAVFNERTGVVEGILVRGRSDYYGSYHAGVGPCRRVNICKVDGSNCTNGNSFLDRFESVTKMTYIKDSLEKAIKGELK